MIELLKKIYNNCFNEAQIDFLKDNPDKYKDMYYALKRAIEKLIKV